MDICIIDEIKGENGLIRNLLITILQKVSYKTFLGHENPMGLSYGTYEFTKLSKGSMSSHDTRQ